METSRNHEVIGKARGPFMFFPNLGFAFGINRNVICEEMLITTFTNKGPDEHGVDYALIQSELGMDRSTAFKFVMDHGHGFFAHITKRSSYRYPSSSFIEKGKSGKTEFDIDKYFDLFAVRGIEEPSRYTFHVNRNPNNYLEPLQVKYAILHLYFDGLTQNKELEIVDFSNNTTKVFASFKEYVDQLEEMGQLSMLGDIGYYDLSIRDEENEFLAELVGRIQNWKSRNKK